MKNKLAPRRCLDVSAPLSPARNRSQGVFRVTVVRRKVALGVALGGLACASIYPTMLAIAGDRYRSFAGTVFGVLFAVGLSGGMVFPWSIGHLSQSFGFRAGMAMPVLGAAMICLLLLVIRARPGESSAISHLSSGASERPKTED